MCLHGEPRTGGLQLLPERMPLLLRQQRPPQGAGELPPARPFLSPAAWQHPAHGHHQTRQADKPARQGIQIVLGSSVFLTPSHLPNGVPRKHSCHRHFPCFHFCLPLPLPDKTGFPSSSLTPSPHRWHRTAPKRTGSSRS